MFFLFWFLHNTHLFFPTFLLQTNLCDGSFFSCVEFLPPFLLCILESPRPSKLLYIKLYETLITFFFYIQINVGVPHISLYIPI
jgi:hypothetical protein